MDRAPTPKVDVMTDYTPFTESNALLAVIRDDLDEARRIIATMLPGERRALVRQAYQLADLINEHDDIVAAASGPCRWGTRHLGSCGKPSSGYIDFRGHPRGICQGHRGVAEEDGYTVHEPPTEVKL